MVGYANSVGSYSMLSFHAFLFGAPLVVQRAKCLPAMHGVAKSQTLLGDFTFTFHFHALEEEMATHPNILA